MSTTSRFLPLAALAAASAGVPFAAWTWTRYDPVPVPASPPTSHAVPAATSNLAALAAAAVRVPFTASAWMRHELALVSGSSSSSPTSPEVLAATGNLAERALNASAAGVPFAASAWTRYETAPAPGSSSGVPGATGHLALVRAHPGLRELNALLDRETFLVEASHALLACALRCYPYNPVAIRTNSEAFRNDIQAAEEAGDTERAEMKRLYLAFSYTCDGRLQEALDIFARLKGNTPSVCCAALCDMLGRPDEAARYLAAGEVDLSGALEMSNYMTIITAATLGGAPEAVAGARKVVMASSLGFVEAGLWFKFKDADLPERLRLLAFILFLRHTVAKNLREDAGDGAIPS